MQDTEEFKINYDELNDHLDDIKVSILENSKYRNYAADYVRKLKKAGKTIDHDLLFKVYDQWEKQPEGSEAFNKGNAVFEFISLILNEEVEE